MPVLSPAHAHSPALGVVGLGCAGRARQGGQRARKRRRGPGRQIRRQRGCHRLCRLRRIVCQLIERCVGRREQEQMVRHRRRSGQVPQSSGRCGGTVATTGYCHVVEEFHSLGVLRTLPRGSPNAFHALDSLSVDHESLRHSLRQLRTTRNGAPANMYHSY